MRTSKWIGPAAVAAVLAWGVSAWGEQPKITDKFALESYINANDSGGVAARQGGLAKTGALTASEQLALAFNGVSDAMGLLNQQMGIDSMNSPEMEDRWQYVSGAFFRPARTRLDVAEQTMAEKKQNLSTGKEQRDGMRAFMTDVETNGGACMVWKRKLATTKFCMEHDVTNFAFKSQVLAKELAEALEAIKKAREVLAASDAKVKQIDEQIVKVTVAARVLSACGARAEGIRETIRKNYGEKAPEMDKAVKEVLAAWKASADKHAKVSGSLREYLPKWAEKHQKVWDEAAKARKAFDTSYAPVLEGKMFAGNDALKGLKYDELDKAARDVQVELTARRMTLRGKAGDEATVRKALEEEKKISVGEKVKWNEYNAKWGPSAEREKRLELAGINSAGKVREIRLRSKTGEEADAEIAKLDAEEKRVREEWEALKKKADAEFDAWWTERAKRRAKLGLTVSWD